MTRVAIIGNSHVGALREAESAIKFAFPTLEITYFALARHRFNNAQYGEDGFFRADIPDEAERKSVIEINGMTEIDLRDYTHILVVGQGFLFNGLYTLIAQYNILGLTDTGKAQSISKALLRDTMLLRIRGFGNRIARKFHNDPRFVIAQKPFPCLQPDATTDHAATAAHPDAAQIADLLRTTIADQMARHPVGFLPAPDDLLSGPLHTKPEFSRAAMLPADQPPSPSDFTHVNARYGFELFKIFANQWLGLVPVTSPQTEKV
ncbi:MAG: hypothetical protein Q9M48_05275 [Rhodobacterales bacterium]|nr:hypothetical protein [Rhodobacterales bacterium]